MNQNNHCPCTNCITYAICKLQFIKEFKFLIKMNGLNYTSKDDESFRVGYWTIFYELSKKCVLINDYVVEDYVNITSPGYWSIHIVNKMIEIFGEINE